MFFGKEVSCSMEGDTAGPSLFFQQTEDDAFRAAQLCPNVICAA